MAIKDYMDGDTVLARHVPEADAWGVKPLNFFSKDPEFIQFGTWAYDSGKELLAHTHKVAVREVPITQEVLYIRKGRIRANIFDLKLVKVATFEAAAGDLVVMLTGGHGYDILEDGTQVLEVKNGPYVGAEADRVRLADVKK